jgi:putative ATP-dependent endonuclease of the OLD family
MDCLSRIKMHNFRKFSDLSICFDKDINILIGDNESGKSTILQAIDLVLSASRTKIESTGLDHLFNKHSIDAFLKSKKEIQRLPELFIELYLFEQKNPDLFGKNNSEQTPYDGLRLHCAPDLLSFSKDIMDVLSQDEANFPFEFYSINFSTFSGEGYAGHGKYFRHLLLDNTQISNEYATREYVKTVYNSSVENSEKYIHKNEYRKFKERFKNDVLNSLNSRLQDYTFILRTGSKSDIETDITIAEDNVDIEDKGKGKQCFIKTQFALTKGRQDKNIDIVLLEEPENHLSHVNMKKLIGQIKQSQNSQVFIATHNNLICNRLDLRKAILLHNENNSCALLNQLPPDTAKFFMKAPDNNILEYILSSKTLLVEGAAEYILMDRMFETITGHHPEDDGVHIISIGGLSFKRYMDLGKLLNIKTAMIRDNDRDFQSNCIDNYQQNADEMRRVFFEVDNSQYTFEVAFFLCNKKICRELFGEKRNDDAIINYLLANKADAALEILEKKLQEITPPNYIIEALKWISE